jgi:serine/threonine protein kinase
LDPGTLEESLSADASATLSEGRYRLIEVIGSGGMATVYRAFDTRLQVERAIKVLLPALANRERLRARFEAEARTMALLEHRNIVRVYDVGSEGNRVYIVMELVDGGSLVDRLEEGGPLPPRQAVDVCLHVLAGLAVSHSRNIVHRDIKPHNVLLTSDGEVRVTDFGIARLAESNDNLTKTGAIMGTWGFMAPEQRADSKGVDARADLYSVAATLYSCVTNETPMDLFAAELDSSMLARVPEPLAEVIRKATRYDRQERYPDTVAMAADLRRIRDRLPPVPADAPPLAVPPVWTQPEQATPPTRPLQDSPSDRGPGSQDTIQPHSGGAIADGDPTPTMVPDRTPPPPARENYTFDAFGGDTSMQELEDRAVAAARPASPAEPPAVQQAVVPHEPDFLDDEPRKRSRMPMLLLAGLALIAVPAVAVTGGFLVRSWRWTPEAAEPVPAVTLPDPPQPEPPTTAPIAEPGEDALADAQPGQPDDPGAAPLPAEPPIQPAEPPARSTPRVVPTQPRDPTPAPSLDPAPDDELTAGSQDAAADAAPPEPAAEEAPALVHTPLASVSAGSMVTINARVTSGRYKVTLYYRPASSGQAYQAKVMMLRGAFYQASVKLDDSFASGLEYHIKAVAEEPGLDNLSSGSGFRPHRVAVD